MFSYADFSGVRSIYAIVAENIPSHETKVHCKIDGRNMLFRPVETYQHSLHPYVYLERKGNEIICTKSLYTFTKVELDIVSFKDNDKMLLKYNDIYQLPLPYDIETYGDSRKEWIYMHNCVSSKTLYGDTDSVMIKTDQPEKIIDELRLKHKRLTKETKLERRWHK